MIWRIIKVEVEAEDKTVELTETLIIRSTERFHSHGQLIYADSLEQKKLFTYEKSSTPRRLAWNMAWNMAALTSSKNALLREN